MGSIGSQAFGNCSGISSISIPAATSSIDFSAFDGCSNLTAVNVESGNGSYSTYDGAVYNSSLSQLLYCPVGKSSLKLPDGMTTISSSAFANCPYVYSLEIPSSVTTIEADAFSGSGIGTVKIPKTVTSIGTQSSWTPDVIYGSSGSAAEQFANENGYIFEATDGKKSDPGNDPEPPQKNPPKKNDPTKPTDTNPTDTKPTNTKPGTTGGGTTTTKGSTTTVARATGSSASKNMGTAQVQSGTPKTGIAFDARYALCAGFFLAGACLIITRKKKGMKA